MNSLFYSSPVLVCRANDNDAYIPERWTQEGVMILEENMVMAGLVHRDFNFEVAQFGDVVNTRKPGEFNISRKTDADNIVTQDASSTNIQVPLDQHFYTSRASRIVSDALEPVRAFRRPTRSAFAPSSS